MPTGPKPEGRPEIPDLDVGAPRADERAAPPKARPSGAGYPAVAPGASRPAPKISGSHPRIEVNVPDLSAPAQRASSAPVRRASGGNWPSAAGPEPQAAAPDVRISRAPGAEREPLELPLPGAAAAPDGKSASVNDYFGTGNFDGDHFGGDDGYLAIETSEPIEMPRGFSSFPPMSAPLSPQRTSSAPPAVAPFRRTSVPPISSGVRAADPTDRRTWPTGTTPPTESIQIERAVIVELSGYGAVPTSALFAPLYSLRVLQQRRKLRVVVRELANVFGEAERARDELLSDLAESLRVMMPEGSPGAKLYEGVSEKEKRARDEQGALANTNSEYRDRVKAQDAEAAEVARGLAAARGSLVDRQSALVEAEKNRSRAEAKKKRLFIELAAIVEKAEKTGVSPSAEEAIAVGRLEAAIAAQKPDLETLQAMAAEKKAAFTGAENEERRWVSRKRVAEKKRRALDTEFEKKIGSRNDGATAAERETEAALAEVGRAVLAARGKLIDVESDVLSAIERADSIVIERATVVEKHVRALDSHDADAYGRGFVVAIAALVLVVVVIVVITRL